MGFPLPKESRRYLRRPLMGDLTGRLFVAESGRPISCLAVDVSVGGLRVLAREELTPGAAMLLAIEGCTLPLAVVWCQPDAKSRKSYACGLASPSATDLEKFFITFGWLPDNCVTDAWIRGLEIVNINDDSEE